MAGGLELLLGCDMVVASSSSSGCPRCSRLFAAGSGTSIGQRIPLAVALEIALTGEMIDAERAYELGLVNKVVPPDEVLDAALALAERIAANGPLGVAASKELVRLAAAAPTRPGHVWQVAEGRLLQRGRPEAPRPSSRSARPCGRAVDRPAPIPPRSR